MTPFVGTADDVAAAMGGHDGLGCVDLDHDVLARERARGAGAPAARTRGFVKVQDGCDCHCAYCIIPTVRGSARSRPASAILAEVAERVAQRPARDGDDRDQRGGLPRPRAGPGARRADDGGGPRARACERVRLSSVEVIHVKDTLLEALATEPKVCPHLHVPMQSGDDDVLRAMGRHYSAAPSTWRTSPGARRRGRRGGINVTTDVIVGFPTEDEAAFERTLDAVDAAGITRVHVFPYSPRPGTVAADLGDRVDPAEKKRRSQVLRGRSELRSRLHRSARLGSPSGCSSTRSPTPSARATPPTTRAATCPPAPGSRGDLVDVECRSLHADGIRCSRDA